MQTVRSILVSSILPAALIVGAAYQGLMAVNGPEGFAAAERLSEERMAREARVAALEARQSSLEGRAERLVLASLDEDLLEERVRANLAYMRPGEKRIRLDDLDRVAATEVSSEEELTSLIAVALLDRDV